jgi:hypothetical protein
MASLKSDATDRGMVFKPRFDSGGSSTPKGVMEPLAGLSSLREALQYSYALVFMPLITAW